MHPLSLLEKSAVAIASEVREKRVSALEMTKSSLQAIAARNKELNAFIRVHDEAALKRAAEIDARIAAGESVGPLAGVPIAIKDNLALTDTEVTACSKILEGFKPPYTATAVQKLLDAGAVIVGQTNMDEFAMGSSTETSVYGPCRNPVDSTRVPGGSSGGSASAVGAGFCPIALGSDTGGSIRQPASFCGVVGFKPTYGRVSRYGLFAYASSLDQIGPLCRTVEDAALILSLTEGKDNKDSTTTSTAPLGSFAGGAKGLKIGVPKEFMDTARGLDPKVAQCINDLLAKLEKAGAEIHEVSLPILDYVTATYYLIANCEASSNLARYDSIRYGYRHKEAENLIDSYKKTRSHGFGQEVKTRILLGTYALSAGYYDAYYKKADAIRADMRVRMAEILSKVDVLLGPTAPNVAFKVGEIDDPLIMYMQDLYTTFVNLVSAPAISVPCGMVDGMPVGAQIVGRLFDDATVLRAGAAVEALS